jgi:hypothetical protein
MELRTVDVKHKELYSVCRILSHPLILIGNFLILHVSSILPNGWGINYLIHQIINQDPISALPLAGIILILLSWAIFKRKVLTVLESVMNIVGLICLFIYARQLAGLEPKLTQTFSPEVPIMGMNNVGFMILLAIQLVYFSVYRSFGWEVLTQDRNSLKIWD